MGQMRLREKEFLAVHPARTDLFSNLYRRCLPPPILAVCPQTDSWTNSSAAKVVRVGVVYAAVGYAVFQGVDLVFPRLGLPDWTVTFVIALGLVGFPIALVLAWAFDVTPDGIRPDGGSGGADSPPSAPTRWISPAVMVTALLMLGAGLGLGWVARGGGSNNDPATVADAGEVQHSIAVLPFTDMSAAGDMAYFGDGIAEEILNVLAHIPNLRVAGRTSSFSFRDQQEDIAAIAEALDVGTVLEGSIRVSGDRLRVTAQLIRASDQSHLWSENYDRTLSEDLFDIQDDIASSVASALQVELGTGGEAMLNGGTRSVEAYDLYIRGRAAWQRRVPEAFLEAEELLQQALDIDQNYAEAWAALSEVYSIGWGNGYEIFDYEEAMASGEAAAARAMQLAPDISAGVRALSYLRWTSHDPSEALQAEALMQQAIELNPSDAWAKYWRSQMLIAVNRLPEAEAEVMAAVDLEPLALMIQVGTSQYFGNAREYEKSLEAARRVLAIDPSYTMALFPRAVRAGAVEDQGFADLLVSWADDSRLTEEQGPTYRALAYALRGEHGEARAALDARSGSGVNTPLTRHIAARALELGGDVDGAFVELALIDRPFFAQHLPGWPDGALRSDPRFFEIFERAGLGEFWRDELVGGRSP